MEEETYDLDLLWCIDCLQCHGPDCPLQGPLLLIKDTPTVSHCVASLPSTLGLMETSEEKRLVVARQRIARRTLFGPLEAMERNDGGEDEGFVLKIFQKDGSVLHLDTTDERRCNWMTLVTIATTAANQNLIIDQYKGALYFTVTRDIEAGEILRVWYAPHYAAKLGKPILGGSISSTSEAVSLTINQSTTPESGNHDAVVELFSREIPQVNPSQITVLETDEVITLTLSPPLILTSTTECSGSKGSQSNNDNDFVHLSCNIQSTENATICGSTKSASQIPTESASTQISTSDKSRSASTNLSPKSKNAVEFSNNAGQVSTKEDCASTSNTIRLSSSTPMMHSYKTRSTTRMKPLSSPSKSLEATFSSEEETCSSNETSTKKCTPARRNLSVKASKKRRSSRSPKSKISKTANKYFSLTDEEYEEIMERISKESLRSCCECSQFLDNEEQLKDHISTEHQKEPVKCSECGKLCVTPEQLSAHVDSNHADAKMLGCPQCDKRFLHAKFFRSHLKKFHDKVFNCSACHNNFWDRKKFLCHVREHQLQGIDTDTTAMFKCDQCGREFTSQAGMNNHITIVHDGRTYKCQYCSYSAACEITFHEHILNNHPENDLEIPASRLSPCDSCNAVFLSKISLKRHRLNHTKREFKCEKCDHVYTRKTHLKNHNCVTGRRRIVTAGESGCGSDNCNPFECHQCSKLFSNRSSMRYHAQTHQSKRYTCNICNREFHKRFNFETHKYYHLRVFTDHNGVTDLIQVGGPTKHRHSCHICRCQFGTMQKLIKHLQLMHLLTTPPDLCCVPCQRLFLTAEELSVHVVNHVHVPLPEGMTIDNMNNCHVCFKIFIGPQELATHMKQHSDSMNHICEFCGQTFRRMDCLRQHISYRHRRNRADKQGKIHNCYICSKTFKAPSSLGVHMKTHSGQQDYQCPYCQRRFIQSGNFNRHVLGHNKEKTVQCDICSRMFKFTENLKKHKLVHKTYDFSCGLCDQRFSTQRFLNNHVRKVHDAEEACRCEHCGVTFTMLTSYRKHMSRKHCDVARQDYRPFMENYIKLSLTMEVDLEGSVGTSPTSNKLCPLPGS